MFLIHSGFLALQHPPRFHSVVTLSTESRLHDLQTQKRSRTNFALRWMQQRLAHVLPQTKTHTNPSRRLVLPEMSTGRLQAEINTKTPQRIRWASRIWGRRTHCRWINGWKVSWPLIRFMFQITQESFNQQRLRVRFRSRSLHGLQLRRRLVQVQLLWHAMSPGMCQAAD